MENLHTHIDAMRAPWTTGDFGAMSRAFGQPVADEFVAGLEDVAGRRVLDVACGTGAATLPLARRGAFATGLDLAPNLLAEARAAAAAERLRIPFDEGFAEQLPYSDGSFDLATSMFGVIFSPFPERIAVELHRVLAPDGRIALANWTPDSFSGRSQMLAKPYLPPSPSDVEPPFAWGEPDAMQSLLDAHFREIVTEVVPTRWSMPFEPAKAAVFFAENAGPLRMLLARMGSQDRSALMADFTHFFTKENRAPPDSGRTEVYTEYLKVTATRR
jgi:ubiquinone/menaquinone biosynthesis C-methylase UbiE